MRAGRRGAAHSSLTVKGLNAIDYAARLICHIRDLADEFRVNGPFDKLYDRALHHRTNQHDQGGNAINTVPAECQFEFEFRNLPTMDPERIIERIESYARDTLLPKMLKEHGKAAIEISRLAPGLDATEQAAITQLVRALTENQDKGKVAYGTEAGLFANAGIPSIVCGPGNIEQAHKANEYVSLDQVATCEAFLGKFVHRACPSKRTHADSTRRRNKLMSTTPNTRSPARRSPCSTTSPSSTWRSRRGSRARRPSRSMTS